MVFCLNSTGLYHISSFLILNYFNLVRFRDRVHIDIPIHCPFILLIVMPRSIILHLPGGASGIKCCHYPAREKKAIVWRFTVLNGKPISPIARLLHWLAFHIRSCFIGMPSVSAWTTLISRIYHAIQTIKAIVVNLRAWRKSYLHGFLRGGKRG